MTLPPTGDVAERRETLLAAKLEMGSAPTIARFARDVAITDFAARIGTALNTGRSLAPSELDVDGGSAKHYCMCEFSNWIEAAHRQ